MVRFGSVAVRARNGSSSSVFLLHSVQCNREVPFQFRFLAMVLMVPVPVSVPWKTVPAVEVSDGRSSNICNHTTILRVCSSSTAAWSLHCVNSTSNTFHNGFMTSGASKNKTSRGNKRAGFVKGGFGKRALVLLLVSRNTKGHSSLTHPVVWKTVFLSPTENRWFWRKSAKILTAHSTHKNYLFCSSDPRNRRKWRNGGCHPGKMTGCQKHRFDNPDFANPRKNRMGQERKRHININKFFRRLPGRGGGVSRPGGGGLPTGGQGSKVYVLCAEPKEHKRFRPGSRPGGIGFPAGRIGDRGDREIVYVPNVYVPFPAPNGTKRGIHKRDIHE